MSGLQDKTHLHDVAISRLIVQQAPAQQEQQVYLPCRQSINPCVFKSAGGWWDIVGVMPLHSHAVMLMLTTMPMERTHSLTGCQWRAWCSSLAYMRSHLVMPRRASC